MNNDGNPCIAQGGQLHAGVDLEGGMGVGWEVKMEELIHFLVLQGLTQQCRAVIL